MSDEADMAAAAAHSPWQNPYAERVIGTIRRECVIHPIVLFAVELRLLAHFNPELHSHHHSPSAFAITVQIWSRLVQRLFDPIWLRDSVFGRDTLRLDPTPPPGMAPPCTQHSWGDEPFIFRLSRIALRFIRLFNGVLESDEAGINLKCKKEKTCKEKL